MAVLEAAPPTRLEKIERSLLARSLKDFIPDAWPVLRPERYIHNWHVDAISEHLQAVYPLRQIRNLLITIPPRHAKSLTVSVMWPASIWTEHPEVRFLAASYDMALSTRDNVEMRRLVESPWYQRRWGHNVSFAKDQNQKMFYMNERSGFRMAVHVRGRVTGHGGDILLCDDPHAVNATRDEIEEGVAWFADTYSSRVNDPKTAAFVVVMQRVADNDLAATLIKKHDWDHLCIPSIHEPSRLVLPRAIAAPLPEPEAMPEPVEVADSAPTQAPQLTDAIHPTSLGWVDPRTEEGELLFPERFGPAELEKAKVDLGHKFQAQHQQRPAPAEGASIKIGWIKYWKVPQPREWFDELLASWDMTFKDHKRNDFVVGQVWGRKAGDFYLLDQTREQMGFTASKRAVEALTAKWQLKLILVEDAANGPAIIDSLKRDMPGLIGVPADGSKEARLESVSPLFESGNVFIPDPARAPWVQDYVTELTRFPKWVHDDQVDATSQALRRLWKVRRGLQIYAA